MGKKIGTKETKLGTVNVHTCDRCSGTGSISQATYRVCYKCGGFGTYTSDTKESARNAKIQHIAQVQEEIALETQALERATLKNRPGSMRIAQERLDASKANLARLEAELTEMA